MKFIIISLSRHYLENKVKKKSVYQFSFMKNDLNAFAFIVHRICQKPIQFHSLHKKQKTNGKKKIKQIALIRLKHAFMFCHSSFRFKCNKKKEKRCRQHYFVSFNLIYFPFVFCTFLFMIKFNYHNKKEKTKQRNHKLKSVLLFHFNLFSISF